MALNLTNTRRALTAEQEHLDGRLHSSFNALMDGIRPNNGARIEKLARERVALVKLIATFNEYADIVTGPTDQLVGQAVPVTYSHPADADGTHD
jgi:hypothetical protein